jgi:hypothetical protein
MFHPNHAETAEGELVSTESTGYIKIRSLIKGLNRQDILRFWCCWMEWTQIKLTQLSKKHNRISRMVQIKDLAGLNLYQVSSKPAMGHFKQVNRMLHDMYPDTLNTLIMINTPKIFSAIWKMFKPLLPKKTQGKIKMVETGSAEQTKTLQLHLPPSDPVPHLYPRRLYFSVSGICPQLSRSLPLNLAWWSSRILKCSLPWFLAAVAGVPIHISSLPRAARGWRAKGSGRSCGNEIGNDQEHHHWCIRRICTAHQSPIDAAGGKQLHSGRDLCRRG